MSTNNFLGTYLMSADSKDRVVLPVGIRNVISRRHSGADARDVQLYVTKTPDIRCGVTMWDSEPSEKTLDTVKLDRAYRLHVPFSVSDRSDLVVCLGCGDRFEMLSLKTYREWQRRNQARVNAYLERLEFFS